MSTETLRAAFEAWAAKETPPYRLERVLVPVSDLYAWNSTACAWEAFQAGAIAAAKQAEPVAQWVSVQERLPERNTDPAPDFAEMTELNKARKLTPHTLRRLAASLWTPGPIRDKFCEHADQWERDISTRNEPKDKTT